MSFIGKRVNLFLLMMIILILIGFGGVSVYYQHTFKEVNSKYNNLNENYDVCSQNLSYTSNELKKALQSLVSTTTDIRKYDQLYETKESALKEKEDALTDVQADLAKAILQKDVYKKQIDSSYLKINLLNTTIKNLEKENSNLERDIFDKNKYIECLLDTDDDLEGDECSE